MSFAPGSSAIAHLAGPKMNNLLDSRHPSVDIDNALIPTANTTDPPDTADMDHTLKTIVAMIIISALIGNTLLSAFSVLIVLVAYRITTPETTTITDAALACEDLTPLKPVDAPSLLDNAAPANPTQDARTDDKPSEAIPHTEEEVHVYRYTRPTFDITEVLAPAPVSKIDTSLAINDDNDCTGGLASDVFDFKTFERYLAEDKMYLTHPIHPNPAITSTGLKVTKKTNKKKSKKIAKAARPAPKLFDIAPFNNQLASVIAEELQAVRPARFGHKNAKTTVFNPKLSMIAEEDEIEEDIESEEHKLLQEEDIELPRSGSSDDESGHDNSFNSCADLEEFSEDGEAEDIIAFAKKVNRMCEELEKVERFSEPVEHTIALAQDWDATFRKWDEEELETFSDSEEDAIALAKEIEFETRPSPPPTPVRAPSPIEIVSPTHTPEGTPQIIESLTHTPEGAPCFTESGFLIEAASTTPADEITEATTTAKFTESGFLIESSLVEKITEVPTTGFTESGFLVETPSNTPADQTPEAPETRFTESGFLIESPDNSPAPYTPTPASRISRIPISRIPKATPKAVLQTKVNPQTEATPKAAPKTPIAIDLRKSIFGPVTQKRIFPSPEEKPIVGAQDEKPTFASPMKPIFASPIGSPFGQHNRKVSNESNTTEESNQTNDTVGTTATTAPPDSPKLAYSTHSTPDDNVYSYQAMTGFTVCLSAKKGTGITFDPITISGENINYDRDALKEISPSPTSSHFGPANPDGHNHSTTSTTSEEEQWETPYHYSTTTPAADGEEEDELQILAILERPSTGRKYAKLSCGNWYGYRETPNDVNNDDGFEVDHLTWDEYEDLIRFIVGDVASLPTKLHKFAREAAEECKAKLVQEAKVQRGEEVKMQVQEAEMQEDAIAAEH